MVLIKKIKYLEHPFLNKLKKSSEIIIIEFIIGKIFWLFKFSYNAMVLRLP